MRISTVDPREVSLEDNEPTYRVYFWHRPPSPTGGAAESMAWNSEEWRLTDVRDVVEVLVWSEANVGQDRLHTVYVEFRDGGDLGLLRLAGATDPNGDDSRPPSVISVDDAADPRH
jgi:hypothetical protein